MSDYSELKKLALAQPIQSWVRSRGRKPDMKGERLMYSVEGPEGVSDYEDWGFTASAAAYIAAADPSAVLALIAENEEYKAVAEQPASLNAVPATEYAVLKRQFFALRNYALCKDKLSGYYSRELEKLRGVDRSQSAGEIDAERDINEQLTNDLLTVETERDQLKSENEEMRRERQGKVLCDLELFETLRDSANTEADEHRQCMATYRPLRQASLDSVVHKCDDLLAAIGKGEQS